MPLPKDTLDWLIAASALAALWAGWVWKLRPPLRRLAKRIDTFFDTFNGRPAFVDETTGRTVEAVQPLGVRLGSMEMRMGSTEQLVETLGNAMVEMKDLMATQISHQAQLDNHEGRIGDLETREIKEIATRVESAQFMRLIADEQGAAPADPIEPPEGEQ